MFTITNVDNFVSFNVKCNPELAVELRESHPAVLPGYHMNKKHWNTVMVDGTVSDAMLTSWIDDSYDLVVDKLTNKQKEDLSNC